MSNGAIVSMTVKEAETRPEMTESNREGTARNVESTGTGAAAVTATKGTPERYDQLLSRIVERTNMQQAYHRVVRNRSAAGVDGMSVEYLVKNGLRIKELLRPDRTGHRSGSGMEKLRERTRRVEFGSLAHE